MSLILNKPFLCKGMAAALSFIWLAASSPGQQSVLIDHGASWAGGVSGNQETLDFFNNNFSNVVVTAGDYSDTGNASVQTAIAGADVLVLCRTTYSGGYSADDDAWYNANLTIPIISLTSYLTRSGKLGWEGGEVSSGSVAGNEATVTAAGSSVFGAAGTYDWYSGSGSFDAAGTGSTNDALIVIEAESGVPGTEFATNILGGVTHITISTDTVNSGNPGSDARVATYEITFPEADTYQLYARLYVGPGTYSDDSFFYARTFGIHSSTDDADWYMVNGLASAGFTASDAEVTTGGSAGSQVWKWVKWSTMYTVAAADLTKTFQIGAREDGLYFDKLVFGPSDVELTVQNLDDGTLPPPPTYSTNTFDGPFGIAIHRFDETSRDMNADGANPVGLTAFNDGLCGITFSGGAQGEGSVFMMSLDGTEFAAAVALSCTENAGFPQGGLAVAGNVFYGTSTAGGANNTGAVFAGQTNGTISLLHSFDALSPDKSHNAGGAGPCAELVLSGSTLYGAASAGGANGQGTLFSVSSSGIGFTVLHEFSTPDVQDGTNADGSVPCGGLVLSGSTLYGTASGGGADGAGVVFSIGTDGADFIVLHDFAAVDPATATNFGGAFPCSGLVLSNNVLYGSAPAGGAGGAGTLFAVGTDGSGFTVLHDFPATDALGANEGGAAPCARLTLSGNVLYGAASAGGSGGAGSVFSLDITAPDFNALYNFKPMSAAGTNTYGVYPSSPVIRAGNDLYGTAFSGGPGGAGTVFRIPIPVYASVVSTSGGNVEIDFTGAPNSMNIVQAVADLSATPVNWLNVSTNAADGSGRWQFSGDTVLPIRFYRANSF